MVIGCTFFTVQFRQAHAYQLPCIQRPHLAAEGPRLADVDAAALNLKYRS